MRCIRIEILWVFLVFFILVLFISILFRFLALFSLRFWIICEKSNIRLQFFLPMNRFRLLLFFEFRLAFVQYIHSITFNLHFFLYSTRRFTCVQICQCFVTRLFNQIALYQWQIHYIMLFLVWKIIDLDGFVALPESPNKTKALSTFLSLFFSVKYRHIYNLQFTQMLCTHMNMIKCDQRARN